MYLLNISIDCLNYMAEFLNFHDQIALKMTCKYLSFIRITNMILNDDITKRITDKVLNKYTYLKRLKLTDNYLVRMNLMSSLIYLDVSGIACRIQYNQIKQLFKLQTLNISYNPFIYMVMTNVNEYVHLECLNITGCNGMDISKLLQFPNLKKIICKYHPKSNDIIKLLKYNDQIKVYC